LSKGGMKSKILAARAAIAAGCDMAITAGAGLHPLQALEEGAAATWFRAQGDPRQKRKQWIAAMKPKGEVMLDAGAAAALQRGSSLLPAGVTGVKGAFSRGDAVNLIAASGQSLGQGLVRYDASDAALIVGRRTDEIAQLLGYPARGPLVHRDDMAI
ncbi:MAG: PUA domain-containing protein, partial [Pseudomonadota bacterium]